MISLRSPYDLPPFLDQKNLLATGRGAAPRARVRRRDAAERRRGRRRRRGLAAAAAVPGPLVPRGPSGVAAAAASPLLGLNGSP